jgi:hypothetical protein
MRSAKSVPRSSPLLKVKLLDKVGRQGKLKVRFEDGQNSNTPE